MQKTCENGWCGQVFETTDEDLAFYDKVSPVFNGKKYLIPPPTHCQSCRQQQRLAFRNERKYLHRECDKCKKKIISQYPASVSFPVYCSTCYWGDGWDAKEYGVAFDETKPFFTQFFELQKRTPRIAFSSSNNENSDYCNHAGYMKNCYLVVGSIECEDCYYCTRIFRCKNCVDCLFLSECELCFDATNCDRCYRTQHAFQCKDVKDSQYVRYCSSSHDLLYCVNRRQAQYQILNEQLSAEEFRKRREEILQSPKLQSEYMIRFDALCLSSPVPGTIKHLSEQCVGNYVSECQRCEDTFDATKCQDIVYGYDVGDTKDCMDVYSFYESELCYESYSGYRLFHCLFNRDCWPGNNLILCDHCFFGCSNCFGCIGLQKQSYCVLNTQYTKEEYEVLVPKIIDHMRTTPYQSPAGSSTGQAGSWGEFFPIQHSQFAYNESAVQDYFPLKKEEVQERGWLWRDHADEASTVDKALTCEATHRPFRIIKQELEYYRRMNLPIPRLHPDERHRRRMALRNPRKLWSRECAKCQKQIEPSYAPERPEIVYCEECYLTAVY
jgi:hypothetical protein